MNPNHEPQKGQQKPKFKRQLEQKNIKNDSSQHITLDEDRGRGQSMTTKDMNGSMSKQEEPQVPNRWAESISRICRRITDFLRCTKTEPTENKYKQPNYSSTFHNSTNKFDLTKLQTQMKSQQSSNQYNAESDSSESEQKPEDKKHPQPDFIEEGCLVTNIRGSQYILPGKQPGVFGQKKQELQKQPEQKPLEQKPEQKPPKEYGLATNSAYHTEHALSEPQENARIRGQTGPTENTNKKNQSNQPSQLQLKKTDTPNPQKTIQNSQYTICRCIKGGHNSGKCKCYTKGKRCSRICRCIRCENYDYKQIQTSSQQPSDLLIQKGTNELYENFDKDIQLNFVKADFSQRFNIEENISHEKQQFEVKPQIPVAKIEEQNQKEKIKSAFNKQHGRSEPQENGEGTNIEQTNNINTNNQNSQPPIDKSKPIQKPQQLQFQISRKKNDKKQLPKTKQLKCDCKVTGCNSESCSCYANGKLCSSSSCGCTNCENYQYKFDAQQLPVIQRNQEEVNAQFNKLENQMVPEAVDCAGLFGLKDENEPRKLQDPIKAQIQNGQQNQGDQVSTNQSGDNSQPNSAISIQPQQQHKEQPLDSNRSNNSSKVKALPPPLIEKSDLVILAGSSQNPQNYIEQQYREESATQDLEAILILDEQLGEQVENNSDHSNKESHGEIVTDTPNMFEDPEPNPLFFAQP